MILRGVILAVAVTVVGGACAAPRAGLREDEADGLALDLGRVLVDQGAYEAAGPVLERGLALNPKSSELHRLLGTVLRARHRYDDAERELATAIELDPKNAEAHAQLGIVFDL